MKVYKFIEAFTSSIVRRSGSAGTTVVAKMMEGVTYNVVGVSFDGEKFNVLLGERIES